MRYKFVGLQSLLPKSYYSTQWMLGTSRNTPPREVCIRAPSVLNSYYSNVPKFIVEAFDRPGFLSDFHISPEHSTTSLWYSITVRTSVGAMKFLGLHYLHCQNNHPLRLYRMETPTPIFTVICYPYYSLPTTHNPVYRSLVCSSSEFQTFTLPSCEFSVTFAATVLSTTVNRTVEMALIQHVQVHRQHFELELIWLQKPDRA